MIVSAAIPRSMTEDAGRDRSGGTVDVQQHVTVGIFSFEQEHLDATHVIPRGQLFRRQFCVCP